MIATDWVNPRSRAATRWVLAVLCAADAVIFQLTALASAAGRLPVEAPPPPIDWLRHTPAAQHALLLVVLWGLWRFAHGAALWPGWIAAIADGLLYEVHVAAFGHIEAEFLIPRACLVGWLVGAWVLRRAVRVEDRLRPEVADLGGWHGALAIFAATYVAAGLSKLLRSGVDWADHRTLDYIIIANLPQGSGVRATFDHFVLNHHGFAAFLAGLTLLLEVGAILALGRGWQRAIACAGIFGFHSALLLMVALFSPGSQVLALLFGVPWPRLVPGWRSAEEAPITLDLARSRTALLVTIGATAALVALAWGTQIRHVFALGPQARLQPWAPEADAPR